MIRFKCPACSKKLRVDDESADKRIDCPACGKAIKVPSALRDEDEEEEAEEMEEDEKPRRKPRKSESFLNRELISSGCSGVVSTLLVLCGILVTIGGCAMDTAPKDVHNIGLLNDKLIKVLGGLLAIGLGMLVRMLALLELLNRRIKSNPDD